MVSKDIFLFEADQIDSEKLIEEIQKKYNQILLDETEQKILFSNITPPSSDSSFLYNFLDEIEVMGRRWRVNVDYNITSHRRLLGVPIVFAKRVARKFLRWLIINPFQSVEEFNQSTVTVLHHLKDGLITMHQEQSEIIEKLILENELLKKKQKEMNEVHKDVVKFIGELSQELSQIKTTARISNERVRRFERWANQSDAASALMTENIGHNSEISAVEKFKENRNNKFDYYLFNEYYRGDKLKIKERQRKYINYFRGKENILDLGCGRGDFSELLKLHNISYIGIDQNMDMVLAAKERGLKVTRANIRDYLVELSDNSVGGIFLGNIADHFTAEDFFEILNLAYQKLEPGSYCVMESVNPQSLQAVQNYPFTDIQKGKLLSSKTAKFIYESAGFGNIEQHYSSNIESGFEKLLIENEKISDYLEKVDSMLYGSQFYSVIGLK